MKNKVLLRRAQSVEAGVSLPETLVALLILMMGIVGVYSVIPLSANLGSTGRDYALLTTRVRDVAEDLLVSHWEDPRLCLGAHREGVGRGRIDVTWTVEDRLIDEMSPNLPGRTGPGGNLKVITITAVARGGTGVGRRDLSLVVLKGRE